MIRKSLFFVAALLMSVSCTKQSATTSASSAGSESSGAKIVNLAIWSNYVSPELVSEFEKRTGIKVQISNYSSNEELLAKLQAGASGYDVAVPSDYMVFAMSKLGLLHELDYSQLTNANQLDARYLKKQYDTENKFSVPYDWGTTGIAVNRDIYKGPLKGWNDLFSNPALAGKFTLLDDVRETMGMALKALGFSMNSKDPAQLAKAKELLTKTRSKVKAFTSEPMMPLVNGETAIAHAYLSDALQAKKQSGGKIDYLLPEEGCTIWIDNLVIPNGATHVREAHQFINFLLEARSNVSTVMNVFVSPANRGATALLPKEFVATNKILFPTEAQLKKCEMIQDLGDSLSLWDRAWTEVKAAKD